MVGAFPLASLLHRSCPAPRGRAKRATSTTRQRVSRSRVRRRHISRVALRPRKRSMPSAQPVGAHQRIAAALPCTHSTPRREKSDLARCSPLHWLHTHACVTLPFHEGQRGFQECCNLCSLPIFASRIATMPNLTIARPRCRPIEKSRDPSASRGQGDRTSLPV